MIKTLLKVLIILFIVGSFVWQMLLGLCPVP